MAKRAFGDNVATVGTAAIAGGVALLLLGLVDSTTLMFVGALLMVSGLLLRIESAILRAGHVPKPPAAFGPHPFDDDPSRRPWEREPDA